MSPSRGALAGAARDLAAHRAVGSPRGWHWAVESGAGAGAGAQVCGAAATDIVPGGIRQCHRRPDAGVMDQDLRRSEAWLGKRRHLVGMTRAVVAGLPPKPIIAVMARGSILLGHGVVLGGAWWGG